jgi:hypothetical protein
MRAMRSWILILVLLMLAISAAAIDLGPRAPAKPERTSIPPAPDPAVLRQGGDTVLDAVEILIYDVVIEGTTAGYVDDYDEVCPYAGSTSPDVVYTFLAPLDCDLLVDMYGSDYDTKIYLYDQDLNLIACNDDFHDDYTSLLAYVPIFSGTRYYLVIDGYGGASGDYTGWVTAFSDPHVDCPAGAELENEPPLVDGYVDSWNGGCNSPEFGNPFQPITGSAFCGKAGFYLDPEGVSSRDTDWFTVAVPAGGVLEVVGDAEGGSYMFELGPQDCGSVGVLQLVAFGPYNEAAMSIAGPPGATVWLWVGPQTFWQGLTYEYDYVLLLNLATPVAECSWTAVKALFR